MAFGFSRQDALSEFVDTEHFRHRVFFGCFKDLFALPARVILWPPAGATPLVKRTLTNFQQFLSKCFNLESGIGDETAPISFHIYDRNEGCDESFCMTVTFDGIVAGAANERGLLQATHYLERLVTDKGASLPFGKIVRRTSLALRFTEGVFVPGMQTPSYPGEFSDEYLGLMSHFGANALKFYINLFHLWRSEALPELNTSDFDEQIDALRIHVKRLAEFGLDLYLHLNTGPLSGDHDVFAAHPEVKGSRSEIAIEELSGKDWNVLCSSSAKVVQGYRESIEAIFAAIPELGGAIILIGGECFHHCFTRPANSKSGETNCPHCRGRDAHLEVAGLVNAVHEAIPPGKRLLAWPYSAFVWSGEDRTQSRWIEYLDMGVEVLLNFDCFDEDEHCDAGVRFFDYNIKLIGPSSVFQTQRDVCQRRGLKFHVKTETTTTPDTFFLPYLPVHFRWYERFKAIRESGASGYMGQWRFYGMTGSIPEELQYHSVWNPERSAEDLLSTIARRDFGLEEKETSAVVEAWRTLSESWEDFPYSAMTSGERDAYMRGAWYLGPAHPLIFTPQSRYKLGKKFFQLRGDLVELLGEEERENMVGKPRYIDDLWICLPFGVEKYQEFAGRCRDRWDAGLEALKKALGPSPNQRAQMELDVCETISIHLHSLVNTVEFLRQRDRIAREPQDQESLDVIWEELTKVTDQEIANASRALPILARDPRIGFGYTYGEVYDTEMVREKIEQCRFVRENEIPRLRSFMRFHLWQN